MHFSIEIIKKSLMALFPIEIIIINRAFVPVRIVVAGVACADSKNAWKKNTVGSEKLKCDSSNALSSPIRSNWYCCGLCLKSDL